MYYFVPQAERNLELTVTKTAISTLKTLTAATIMILVKTKLLEVD